MAKMYIDGKLVFLEDDIQINETLNYPIVILPNGFIDLFSAYPEVPPEPKEPLAPTSFTRPNEPEKPEKPWSFDFGNILKAFVFVNAISYTFLILIHLLNKESVTELFKLDYFEIVLIIIQEIFLFFTLGSQIIKEKREYLKATEIYKNELKYFYANLESHYSKHNKKIENYKSITLPKYQLDIATYKLQKDKILSIDNLANFRMKLIENYFKDTTTPNEIKNPYLTGVSEDAFFRLLIMNSSNFKKGLGIANIELNNKYYVPDIVYWDKNTGLLIDIEIDEPYIGIDGVPIHFEGNDFRRNSFFSKNGWIIIRFAEEQIIKFPQDCKLFLDQFIDSISSGKLAVDFPLIKKVPQWTKDEAHKMAYTRYRNNYLQPSQIKIIKEETIIEPILDDRKMSSDTDFDLPF